MTQTPTPNPTSKKLRRALVSPDYFSPFGNKLIQSGFADKDQLKKALVEVRKSKRPLLQVLEQITHRELSPELARQYKQHYLFELKILYGVDCMDAETATIDAEEMTGLIRSIINIKVCRQYKLLPIRRLEQEPPAIEIAMVNPDDLQALDTVKNLLRSKGLKFQRIVITEEDYEHLLKQYYSKEKEKQKIEEAEAKKQEQEHLADFREVVEGLGEGKLIEVEEDRDADLTSDEANQAPIIQLVNKILINALQQGASDIHIEPQEEYLRVRFRKDGVLQEIFSEKNKLPKHITTAVLARFKIMAELDIAERRLPQDGKIRRIFQGRKIDFRVSTLPSRYGEKVVLRILDNSATQLGLDKLITDQNTLNMVREIASRPFGLILVTGPTGSGKSTTLYSVLAERNNPGININTAEDPIEYSLPGITQVQVIREKGMDFASILRAFLRQDPDVILVGETRDKETAKTAIEAALTGHLVLTTLHTNDAAGAIARLDEMGVEPFMISGALLGVLAQRLMRRVCTECRIAYHPTQEELARFGLSASSDKAVTFYKANTLTPEQIATAEAQGELCPKCNGSGYKGRVGVYEFMVITERLQKLINEGATTDRIKEAAGEEGMITILAYSLNLVREGYTTLEEVERVTFTDSGLEAEMKAKRKSSLVCSNCSAELQQEWMDCPYCMTPRFVD
jgi:type IV pilus assembly protein PilB